MQRRVAPVVQLVDDQSDLLVVSFRVAAQENVQAVRIPSAKRDISIWVHLARPFIADRPLFVVLHLVRGADAPDERPHVLLLQGHVEHGLLGGLVPEVEPGDDALHGGPLQLGQDKGVGPLGGDQD